MTKAEIVSIIAKQTGVEKITVLNVVESFMEAVKESMGEGENVYLRGFGSFVVKRRKEKKARNISQETTIIVPERNMPSFKPAKPFIQVVRGGNEPIKKK